MSSNERQKFNFRLTKVAGVVCSSVALCASLTTTAYAMVTTTAEGAFINGGGTTLTVGNNGVAFANAASGAPVAVTGIADGVNPNDAVNVNQLSALGITTAADSTVLSGGANANSSTTLSVGDNGSTFADASGAAVTVTGIADGVNPNDAVNVSQLNAAMANNLSGISTTEDGIFIDTGDTDVSYTPTGVISKVTSPVEPVEPGEPEVVTSSVVSQSGTEARVEVVQVTTDPTTGEEQSNARGLVVGATQTQLSGGTTSSSTLSIDDSGAKFADASGAPVTVTGIADGVNPHDAVNVQQLETLEGKLSGGVAMSMAMQGLPKASGGKTTAGFGISNYNSEQALAVGISHHDNENHVMYNFSAAVADGDGAVSGGIGWSF